MSHGAAVAEVSKIELPERPYPGLRAFQKDEWAIFFGRERMIDEVTRILAGKKFVVVHGDSGCGKSSLVRAGVLPRLEQEHARGGAVWRTAITEPGDAPLDNLATALAELADPEGVADRLDEFRHIMPLGRDAAGLLGSRFEADDGTFDCLLVDQFEELFSFARRNPGSQAEIFAEVLVGLQAEPPPGLHVIVTMRSEFLGACARYAGLAEAINETQYLLPRMEHGALLRAICEPARLYRGEVQRALAQRLIGDAGAGQDHLPLIQHGLMLLHQRHVAADKQARSGAGWALGLKDYAPGRRLSDLLSDHADRVAEDIASRHPGGMQVLEQVFRALTDIDADGHAVRRPQSASHLARLAGVSLASLDEILRPMRRDGVSFLRPYGERPLQVNDRIDVSHEALIRCWGRIARVPDGWLHQEFQDKLIWQSLLIQKDVLSPADTTERAAWLQGKSPQWASRYGGDWGKVEAVIERSKKKARTTRMKNALLYFGIPMLIIGLFGAAYNYQQRLSAEAARLRAEDARQEADEQRWEALIQQAAAEAARQEALEQRQEALIQQQAAEAARDQAERRRLALIEEMRKSDALTIRNRELESKLLADKSLEETRRGDPARGLALAATVLDEEHGLPYVPQSEASAYAALADLRARQVVLAHPHAVSDAAFSPDGKRIATASTDGRAQLWDAETGTPIGEPIRHEDWVHSATFSPDGKRIVTGSADGTARLWDAATGGPIGEPMRHEDWVHSAAFSPDGKRIVTASADGTARLWDAATGGPIGEPMRHEGFVYSAAFSPDGERIVTASQDGTARLWDSFNGAEIAVLHGHEDGVSSANFSPDGQRILTTSSDGIARLWDAASGALIGEPIQHGDGIHYAAFSPDGMRIVTWPHNYTARLWDAATGAPIGGPMRHENWVSSAAFSPDGQRIVTTSVDGTAAVWGVAVLLPVRISAEPYLPRDAYVSEKGMAEQRSQKGTRDPLATPSASAAISFSRESGALDDTVVSKPHWSDAYAFAWSGITSSQPEALRLVGRPDGQRPLAWSLSADGSWLGSLSVDEYTKTGMLNLVLYQRDPENFFRSRGWYRLDAGGLEVDEPSWQLEIDPSEMRVRGLSDSHSFEVVLPPSPDGLRPVDLDGDAARVSRTGSAFQGRLLAIKGDRRLGVLDETGGPTLWLWRDDGSTPERIHSFEAGRTVAFAAFGPDDDRLVVILDTGDVRLVSRRSKGIVALLSASGKRFVSAAIAPHGRAVAAITDRGETVLWQVFPTRTELVEFIRTVPAETLSIEELNSYLRPDWPPPNRSYWEVGDSTVYLEPTGDSRTFYFVSPSKKLRAQGVEPGALLFEGRIQKNDGSTGDDAEEMYVGNVYLHIKGCEAFQYSASGPVLTGPKVVLRGAAPAIDPATCRTLDEADSELTFHFKEKK